MRTRHRGSQRGAAMVEAVIVIPVFVVLWASLYFLGNLFASRQAAQREARSCAWLYSASNCQVVPAGCEAVLTKSHGTAKVPEVDDALKDGAAQALRGGDTKGVVGKIVGELVAGPLLELFTNSVDARSTREVQPPALYGVDPRLVTGSYHLACNLKPTTPGEMASEALSTLVH